MEVKQGMGQYPEDTMMKHEPHKDESGTGKGPREELQRPQEEQARVQREQDRALREAKMRKLAQYVENVIAFKVVGLGEVLAAVREKYVRKVINPPRKPPAPKKPKIMININAAKVDAFLKRMKPTKRMSIQPQPSEDLIEPQAKPRLAYHVDQELKESLKRC